MEHIRQYDWCSSTPDGIHFLSAEAIDKSVTEKILQNKFTNPLISSDSEDESGPGNSQLWDWDQIFQRRNIEGSYHRTFVPGLRPPPPFPRLSALSAAQHVSCLRVLCDKNPHILPDEFMPKPNRFDLTIFEEVKEIYLKEQKEFMEWARSLWASKHCVRALRPKPLVESVYEAEFKMRAQRMKAYPKAFAVVAQIPLDAIEDCEIVLQKDLIDVNISNLPQVKYPEKIDKRWTVLRPCSLPVPCEKHPVQLILPGEKTVSILPLSEVHRELATFARSHGAQLVASEGALRSLGLRRAWALPVTVHAAAADGDTNNIIVLGSEFSNKRENVIIRTFKAYRHLLEFALVPVSEREKMCNVDAGAKPAAGASGDVTRPDSWMEPSSDEEDNLFIDFDEQANQSENKETTNNNDPPSDVEMRIDDETELQQKETEDETEKETHDTAQKKAANASVAEGFGVYTCTCKDTIYERPAPRSFRKYQFRNNKTSEHYDVIVHSAHKYKDSSGEVLLEPIIEYQADLGASKQSEDRIRSLVLSLALRKNASLMNVRIDPTSGDVITFEEHQQQQFLSEHPGAMAAVAGSLHTALDQLQGLVPGQYLMLHEPSHGDNALLYAPAPSSRGGERLLLAPDAAAAADDAAAARAPPALCGRLLPLHKFRKLLPCAFTTYPSQIAREHKRPTPRQKTPPQALKWPKKKGRKKKKTN